MDFTDSVVLVSGASRGLGRRIALGLAAEGARVIVAARSYEENPRLPGTVLSVVDEIRQIGGEAAAVRMDATVDAEIEAAVELATSRYGRLDAVVHTAAALFPTGIQETTLRRWDVLFNLNLRAVFSIMKFASPAIAEAGGGHLLFVAPPLESAMLAGKNVPYALSKHASSLLVVNAARELQEAGIAANCLWPARPLRTEGMVAMGRDVSQLRDPRIFADAARAVLRRRPVEFTGNAVTDEAMLALDGVTDLSAYEGE